VLLLRDLVIGCSIAETVSTESDTTIGEAVMLANSSNSSIFKEKPREEGSTTCSRKESMNPHTHRLRLTLATTHLHQLGHLVSKMHHARLET
jgi:hypothetical protein